MNVCMARQAVLIRVAGAVQGVGFRPFVHRLATELHLDGTVRNDARGVVIQLEGSVPALEEFRQRLEREAPPAARIASIHGTECDAIFEGAGFSIRESEDGAAPQTSVMADLATCPDCLREILDPSNRRHLYPFTNCTNCGPRFSIVTAIPYDRINTTMTDFEMCPACRAEYENPADRRFHAQPNACPICGPKLSLWNERGETLAEQHESLIAAAAAIRDGKIVAVKGLGGFHLVCDARNDDAVRELRRRKHREEKPLAVMFPSPAAIAETCEIGPLELAALNSIQSPIVLLRKSEISNFGFQISKLVAPDNPMLGAMLPYTPLHHLLLRELGFPIIATSGNLSEEPICIDEHEALARLGGIADLFLVHNRRIARPVDDSVARAMAGRLTIIRRSRGYAPLPVAAMDGSNRGSVLAVGGQLKNAVALATGGSIYLSQHIGDLSTEPAIEAFESAARALPALYDTVPSRVVCDLHPDYASTAFAKRNGAKPMMIQHHYAHVLAVMAEHNLRGDVLGVSWDGTGFGTDGTIWGGEFLRADDHRFERIAHFRTFPLPGGEAAIREPRRAALGLLFEMQRDLAFDAESPLREFFSPACRARQVTRQSGAAHAQPQRPTGGLRPAVRGRRWPVPGARPWRAGGAP